MRYISYVFYGSLTIALVIIAIANRAMTELNLLPEELVFFDFNFSISLPIYVIFFSGTIFGVLIGFVDGIYNGRRGGRIDGNTLILTK